MKDKKVRLEYSEYVIRGLDDYLDEIESSSYIQLRNSFKMIKEYYNFKVKHIEGIEGECI